MKKFGLLILVTLGFAQISSTVADYSKMSASELNEAFIKAVKKGSSDEVQELIQAGADSNTPIPYTWTFGDCDRKIKSTALIYAVRHNCPNKVKVLLKVEKELNKALDVAIEEGFSDVIEELIKGGADINYVNEYKDTPLLKAIRYGKRGVIQALLKAGAHVNHSNKDGRTALMEAIIEHDFDTVQYLLRCPEILKGSYFGFGVKPINYADKDGNTALILAIKYVSSSYYDNHTYNICISSQSILKALLEAPGIDPYHVNNQGDTAIKLLEKIK